MERPRAELLTPGTVPAGIAVVAIYGERRLEALVDWLRTPAGRRPAPAELAGAGPRVLHFVIDGAVVDECVFVDRPARESAELHLHGAPAVLRAVGSALDVARPGAAGDAARRLLLAAGDAAQLALALEQIAHRPFTTTVRQLVAAGTEALDAARRRSRIAQALAEPCEVALVGRQNAGKSTLFNALLMDERALTGPTPGLTRDPVSEAVILGGYPYVLVDTAGDGEAGDELDRLALARARERAARADLRVRVVDRSAAVAGGDAGAVLTVHTHADRPEQQTATADAAFDLRDPAGWPAARATLGALLRRVRGLPEAPRRGVGGPAALDAEERALLGGG